MTKYAEMKKQELVNLCEARGLATDGVVSVLIARLKEADKSGVETDRTATTKPSEFAINAMRPAIIGAHKLNNKKAITQQDAIMAGVSEDKFREWCTKCEELRGYVAEYCKLKQIKSVEQEKLVLAKGRIYPTWRELVACGAEIGFHKNWFIREEDIESLVGYNETFIATDMGTQFGNNTPTIFRKKVESLIGCRIAANEVMNDKDRDDLMEFYKARTAVAKATDRLNGTTNNDGEHVKGLNDNIADMKAQIKTSEDVLRALGQSEEEISGSPIIAPFRVQLKALETAKKQAEETLKNNEAIVTKLQTRADQIHAAIKRIEE